MSDENQHEATDAEETAAVAEQEGTTDTPETPQPEQEEEREPTPEEIEAFKQMREEAKKALEEEMPYLEAEEKYHRLKADIEEHKARELTMITRQAQIMYGGQAPQKQPQPPADPDEPQQETPPPMKEPENPMPRKLKTD